VGVVFALFFASYLHGQRVLPCSLFSYRGLDAYGSWLSVLCPAPIFFAGIRDYVVE